MPSKPKEIKPLSYYIVDMGPLDGEPRLLWNEYKTEEEARYAIEKRLRFNIKRYTTCSGVKAIRHKLRFFWDMSWVRSRFTIPMTHHLTPLKYDYPENRVPGQNRKTYRTIMRRRKRKLANQ